MRFTLLLLALPLIAQTPEFEMISIRPSTASLSNVWPCGFFPPIRDVQVVASLNQLIIRAYRDEVDRFDLPEWANQNHFALSLRMPLNLSAATCQQMFRNFLAERFHLVIAIETREVPSYILKLAPSGLKLRGAPPRSEMSTYSDVVSGQPRVTFRSASASDVVASIQTIWARFAPGRVAEWGPLVDETGLTGRYGYYSGEFTFTEHASSRREALAESFADALTQQLGLTLERRKAPGKILIIRSTDRMPSEN